MVLAASRATRLITTDDIAERPRDWLKARLAGHEKLLLLIECPWCIGFWVSLAVVLVTMQFTSVPLPGLHVLAVSLGVGLIAGRPEYA
jgi:hypothetical protein